MEISKLDLLHKEPIFLFGIGHLKVPTLNDIRHAGKSYDTYMGMLNIEDLDLADKIGVPLNGRDRFHYIIQIPDLRAFYEELFRFFFLEDLVFQPVGSMWILMGEKGCVGTINEENFPDVVNAILICNHLEPKKATPMKFFNEKARRIYEKIQSGKKAMQASKHSSGTSIADLVSAVAANSPSYNLFNIWDLTIYQLYDQFAQLNQRIGFDISSMRWAAYSTEKFDLSGWYRPKQKKEE